MDIVLTNLSNELFNDSRNLLNESAKKFGITNINSYSHNDISNSNFYKSNQHILSNPKGSGYWLWKPYIILESMKKISDGDIVIYADCGVEIADDLSALVDICVNETPILVFGNGNDINAHWTKRDCFILMNCDSPKYWYGPQCDASFSLWKKCNKSIEFLEEWLEFGCDERIISDNKNVVGEDNLEGYFEHRRDQSILSLLAQKHQINLYRIPTKFGNHYKEYKFRIKGEFNCVNQRFQEQVDHYNIIPYYNSRYPQLLNHHRTKKVIPFSNLEIDSLILDAQTNQKKVIFFKEKFNNTIRVFLKRFGYELKKL